MEPSANPIIRNEIPVVMAPRAYSDGDVTLVVIVQISSGSEFFVPTVSQLLGNSSYDKVKPNSATAMMPGKTMGTTTSFTVCQQFAPKA